MRNPRFLLRVGGYLVAGVVLGLGAGTGGTAGTVLIVVGLLLVGALLLTFRLR